MAAQPMSKGCHTATLYLVVRQAARALEFYKQAFGAIERLRLVAPDGVVVHAEIMIGNSIILLADELFEAGLQSPQSLGGTSASILLCVEDAPGYFRQAIEAGARVLKAWREQSHGDCSGILQDPFGHIWTITVPTEPISPEEIDRRAEELFKQYART